LQRIVSGADGTTSRELVNRIVADVQQFSGAAGYHDDITVVAVRAL
jgi:serine phosphatase RsbU (regulator of sigma subunit)